MSPSRGDDLQGRRQQAHSTLASVLTVMPVILLLMLGYVLWQGFYTVDAYQQAVVMRFGRFHSTQGPGLHFKVPLVDKAILVDTAEKSLRLPYSVRESQGSAARTRRQDESLDPHGRPLRRRRGMERHLACCRTKGLSLQHQRSGC